MKDLHRPTVFEVWIIKVFKLNYITVIGNSVVNGFSVGYG